jgi:hypothetical protein
MDDPDEVFSIYTYFMMEARQIKNCFVILSTILPSKENQENCDIHFKEMDQALKLITEPSELLGLNKSFRTKSGYVRNHLYEDGVHLNEKATQTLAEQIFIKVNRIPRSFFQ